MRARVAAVALVVSLGSGAAFAVAQQPVPTLTIDAAPGAVSVAAPGPVAAGPTRVEVVRPASRNGHAVYIGLLVPGVSVAQLEQTLARDARTGGGASFGLVSIQASVALEAGEERRGATFEVKPGLTYVVVSQVQPQGDGAPPAAQVTTFASGGGSNGATVAAPDATVRMVDLRFTGDRVLPQRGTIRVQNRGGVPHIAIAFPLRRGVTSAQVGRAIRSDSERAFGRILGGAPQTVQDALSGGDTANDQEIRFARKGRYVMVCFVNDHHRLGMYRVVSVR